ncbi:hypothetical protein [Actinosynnema sp. NPDC020468]|uniref:hypothetical protein n=1 Tax=Actinosynnema sp. NPDC020468 TaxID=3154488 RepID=UPI0033DB6602
MLVLQELRGVSVGDTAALARAREQVGSATAQVGRDPLPVPRERLGTALAELGRQEFAAGEFDAALGTLDRAEEVLGGRQGDALTGMRAVRAEVNGALRRPLSTVADVQHVLDGTFERPVFLRHLARFTRPLAMIGYEPEYIAVADMIALQVMGAGGLSAEDGEAVTTALRTSAWVAEGLGDLDALRTATGYLEQVGGGDASELLAHDKRTNAPVGPQMSRVLADRADLLAAVRGDVDGAEWFVPVRKVGDRLDRVVAALVERQREADDAAAIVLGLEVHALRCVAGDPKADWVEALVRLGRAYADAGEAAQLEDVVTWLRGLVDRAPGAARLRSDVFALVSRLESLPAPEEPTTPGKPLAPRDFEARVLASIEPAQEAVAAGRARDAVGHYRRAAALLRDGVERDPSARNLGQCGSTHYALGEVELALGEHDAAVRTLDVAEEAYLRVAGAGALVADVRTRRARVLAHAGRGLGAVHDAQRALDHYLDRPEDPMGVLRTLAFTAFVSMLVGADGDVAARAGDLVLVALATRGGPRDPLERQITQFAAHVACVEHRELGEEAEARTAAGVLAGLGRPEPATPASRPGFPPLARVLADDPELLAAVRPKVVAIPAFVPARVVGERADEVCRALLDRARSAPPAEAGALALEVHALRSVANVSTPDWVEAVALLERAYREAGLASFAADAAEWLRRLDSDGAPKPYDPAPDPDEETADRADGERQEPATPVGPRRKSFLGRLFGRR